MTVNIREGEVQEKLNQLPNSPGVYKFFNTDGKLLYVGKATSLRSRVQSYFRESTDLTEAKQQMVAKITDIDWIIVDNETEALLLETTLIKEHKPPYNIVMKDDKSFQYIHITDELYPRIETLRRRDQIKATGRYFGPYTSGGAMHKTLHLLKSIFRFCVSPPVQKNGMVVFPKRPCLDYHLGRCVGPCAGVITPEEYKRIFDTIAEFLHGDYELISQQVEHDMGVAAEQERFEYAARLRDQLQAIEQLMVEQKVVSIKSENADYLSVARQNSCAAVNIFVVRKGVLIQQQVIFLTHVKDQTDQEMLEAAKDQYYVLAIQKPSHIYLSSEIRRGRNRKLLEMGVVNAQSALERYIAGLNKRERKANKGIEELAEALSMNPDALKRIEIYDISNIQGNYSVGSMVVFIDGIATPAQYRKFKIKTVQGPNDFASLKEVMDRRLQHLPERAKSDKSVWPRPDLIIIDGGKGQLSSAKSIIDILAPDIPVISLAKQEEEIFVPGKSESIVLPRNSEGLYLMQRMRDEAHRFAIGFYRSRHLKELV